MLRSQMLNNLRKMQTQRNTNGQFKIYQTPSTNSITNLNFKIDKDRLWLSTVMLT